MKVGATTAAALAMWVQAQAATVVPETCGPLPPAGGNTVNVSSVSELDSAVNTAVPGDTIVIADGIYNLDGVHLWVNTPGVSIRSASGNRDAVVLDGNYITTEIIVVAASNVTVADLTLREAYYHPIHVVSTDSADTSGTMIYNVHIVDPGQQAIKINPHGAQAHFPDYGTIACSRIELTAAGREQVWDINGSCYTGGVDAHGARGWTIHDNTISGFWCSSGLAEHAIHLWRGCRDTVVERNVTRDNARGIGFGLSNSGNARTYPDDPCPGTGYVGHYDGVIRNNSVFAGDGGLHASDSGFDCGICLASACGTRVLHNTVASTQNPSASSIEWRYASTDADILNNLVTHNLWERDGAFAVLSGNRTAQPLSLFVDGHAGDLHLATTAAAVIDQVIAPVDVFDDIDGDTRPISPLADVGADELRAATANLPLGFENGFEWGDTQDWDSTVPRRCDELETFDRHTTPTRYLHVAVTGNDSTGDGSETSPFASIARSAQQATPGTAVRVHPGTYAGGSLLADLSGTPSAPIWIGGVPGQTRPILQGGNQGLHLVRAKYVVVHDLEVQGAAFNGINADDGGDYDNPLASHHLVFRSLNIHDVGNGGNQDCLKLSGIRDYTVLSSQFARCGGGGSGSGVDHVGCHRGLIARNVFSEMSANAIQSKGGSEDIEIRWNHFFESGARSLNLGGSTGFEYFRPSLSATEPNVEARDLRVIANLFEGSDAPVGYVGCVNCVVAQNTIRDPSRWLLRILQETTTAPPYTFEACREGVFVNNLVSFEWADLSTWLNIGPNTQPETFTFANNLWHAWDEPAMSQPTLPSPETGGVYGLDPELDADARIPASSPAVAAGITTPWTEGDFGGSCYQDPPSVGAFATPRKLAVRRDAARSGDWGLAVEVGSNCTAAEHETLSGQVSTGTTNIDACESIAVVGNVAVPGGAALHLRAGRQISFSDGFSISMGAAFSAGVDASMSRTGFVQDDSPHSESDVSLSFWINTDALTVGPADEMHHMAAYSATMQWRFRVLLSNGPSAALQVREDSGTLHTTPAIPIGPGWSSVDVSWEATAEADASISVDGGPARALTAMNTAESRIDVLRWGVTGGMLANSSGTVMLDDYTWSQ